jgi:predicted ribosome quality control (RQC) complex YloA/Tae2 family protein
VRTELNFLETHFLVKEFSQLVGSRVNKVYESDGVLIAFHKEGQKTFLRITSKVLWLTSKKPETDAVSNMVSRLRSFLEGKRLAAIEQLGSERIVKFVFETKEERFVLVVELFGNGNLVVTDGEGKILLAQEERAWRDREIRRGLIYSPPPARKDLFSLSESEIPKNEKDIATLGFGKVLAKEIVVRGGFGGYKELLAEKENPRLYSDGELSPIVLKQYSEAGVPYKTFSELIDDQLSETIRKQRLERARAGFNEKRKKIEEVILAQTKQLDKVEVASVDLRRKGEVIYERYQEFESLLLELRKAREKLSWKEIQEKLKNHPVIKEIDPKTGDVVVEVEEK